MADEILAKAETDRNGTFWRTASYHIRTKTISLKANPTLYDGVAGIALFLLDAAEVLGDARHRDAALDSLRWCAATAADSQEPFLFYSGPLGIAFALARAHAVSGDGEFLDMAQRVTRPAARECIPETPGDLIAGTAGTILGLLHLHATLGEPWIIGMLDELLEDLATRARWTPEGVTWSAHKENVRGLCGMSHGNAGVSFVLLEASRYLGRPELLRLATAAQTYEAAYLDASNGSWPDFRRFGRVGNEDFATEYATRGETFFSAQSVMDAWCHGAPGIGLARLRGTELYGGEPWLSDARHALRRTQDARSLPGFTICHGACGNATLFIEAARVLREPRWLECAEAIGRQAIASKQALGHFVSGFTFSRDPDLSLLMGNAGIGDFFLQLVEPELPSVLLPRINAAPANIAADLTEGRMTHILTASMMPATMKAIGQYANDIARDFFAVWRDRDEVLAFLRVAGRKVAPECLALEFAKLEMLDDCQNLALTFYRQWCASEDASQWQSVADLEGVPLRLAPYARIWRNDDHSTAFLLQIKDGAVVEQPLAPLADAVLSSFTEPCSIDHACGHVSVEMIAGEIPLVTLRAAIAQQGFAAATAGLLVRV